MRIGNFFSALEWHMQLVPGHTCVRIQQLFVCAFLCMNAVAIAAEEEKWVGKEVMWKEDAVATLDDRKVDIERIPPIATVGEEAGELLWLTRAWVRKQDVLTLALAVEHYSQKIEAEPGVARWRVRRGWAWKGDDEPDKAIADFDKALELEPKLAGAYCGRAWARNLKGDLAGAVEDGERALAADPNNAQVRQLRGVLFCIQGNYDDGIAELTKAIELDPGCSGDYVNRANAWHDKREFSKALDDFQEAIRLDPRPAAIYLWRGSTWRELGENDKAAQDYSEAIKRRPNESLLFYHRGSAYERLAKYDEAITDYKEAIRLDEKNPFGHSGLAGLLATCPNLKYRNGKLAIVHATRACELTKYTNSNFLAWLAAAHAEAGDSKNAVKWQHKANGLTKDQVAKRIGELLLEHYRQGKRPERPD